MDIYQYTEYGVELLAGEIATAATFEQCERYGPAKWIVRREVIVSITDTDYEYTIGQWQRLP